MCAVGFGSLVECHLKLMLMPCGFRIDGEKSVKNKQNQSPFFCIISPLKFKHLYLSTHNEFTDHS